MGPYGGPACVPREERPPGRPSLDRTPPARAPHPMTALAARVLATLGVARLLAHGTRVLAAVSGGADSVALAHLLATLSAAGALQLVAVAHFDHRLAARKRRAMRASAATLAGALDVPFDVEAVDVAGEASEQDVDRERRARLRYAFLERARGSCGADVVAVAHTSDDQAETVLLRLFRGAGTRGLGGIPPRATGSSGR